MELSEDPLDAFWAALGPNALAAWLTVKDGGESDGDSAPRRSARGAPEEIAR